ncbi:MAG TPA: OmpA family protein [Sphingomicrobium sp.]|nr:OmpA family protein [Sphingomicrobium sp.]
MRRAFLAAVALLTLGSGTIVGAQVLRLPIPRIGPRGQPPPPPVTIEMLQADLVARSGSDTVYFAGSGHGIDAGGQATLVAQARWLLANPAIRVRIEGHADELSPRDFALAIGERRADAVRNFLILQGVPAAQLTIISWGKERPVGSGTSPMTLALNRRAKTVLMR